MAETYRELQKLSNDELIKRYDDGAKTSEFWVDHYLGVLNKRHQESHAKQIKFMTVVITMRRFLTSGIIYDVLK